MFARSNIIMTAVVFIAMAAAVALAQSTAKPLLHAAVFNWAGLKAEPTPTGSRRECFDARTATLDRLECHVTTLNPGEAPHAAHRHPAEEVIIVKAGVLEAMQNGVTNRVETGGVIFQASNELHGLRNPGTNQAVYYVIEIYPHDLAKAGAE
jgi:mannose-6-phosphate isomerase-like protein (cupin superfamily)